MILERTEFRKTKTALRQFHFLSSAWLACQTSALFTAKLATMLICRATLHEATLCVLRQIFDILCN